MKTKTILHCTLLLLFIFNFQSFCQTLPNYEWARCLGGSSSDYAQDLKQTADGGYITAGWANSSDGEVSGNHGNSDIWVVKTDPDGNIEWQKTLGGTFYEYAYSIQITPDGGYIIAGSSSSNDGDVTGHHGTTGLFSDDFWVVKLDASGNILWQKSLGGNQGEIANCIQTTADGGFILCGYTLSNDGDLIGNKGEGDMWIVKLNSLGSIQWQRNYGGSKFDEGNYIIQTNDGGYAVAGYSFSNNKDVTGHHGTSSTCDAWILRISASGEKLWSKSIGGTETDIAFSITENPEGSLVTAGFAYSDDGNVHGQNGVGDWWVVWLDASGNITQDKCYGGSDQESCYSMQRQNDGSYLLAGYNQSTDGDATAFNGATDLWVISIDNAGSILWEQSYGGSDNELGTHAIMNSDGVLVITGYTYSNNGEVFQNHGNYDFWLVKEGTPANATNTSVSGSVFCPGSKLNASFITTGLFNAGNIFTAELSDYYGSFLNPVNIGMLAGTSGGIIHCKIPTVGDGYQYLVRVTSSDPVSYALDNGLPLTITCPQPQNLSVTNLSSTSAKLSWEVVTACDVKYILRYRPVNSGAWITVNNLTSASYNLTNLSPSTTYMWSVRTKCKPPGATSIFINGNDFTTGPLKINDDQNSIAKLSVSPNPLSGSAIIQFSLEKNSIVEIELRNISGVKIKTITEGNFEAGNHQLQFERENLPAGIYLVQLQTDSALARQKLIVVK